MMRELTIRPSRVVLRAALGSWSAILWLWFLRWMRRDMPYPLVFAAALLLALAKKIMPFWCLGWAIMAGYFVHLGMWADAGEAAYLTLTLPALASVLRFVINAYHRINR